MIEVHLFGHLRRYVTATPEQGVVVSMPAENAASIGKVLAHLDIDPEEVSNIFVNGRLIPRSVYPITLGYHLVTDRPLTLEECLAVSVESGDRVGVFPKNMSSVVV